MPMKKLLLVLLLSFTAFRVCAAQKDSLLIMFWNVENFFDYIDQGTGQSDREFTQKGGRHWSQSRFYTKCNAIAKTILKVADDCGRLPDAIGFAEIENGFVIRQLVKSTALRKLDYKIVHYESPDHRGIDCALIYRRSSLQLIKSEPKHIYGRNGRIMTTRDILLAEFDKIDILVNHHPSKVGKGSEEKREITMNRMNSICDSLVRKGHPRIISMGDFNDTLWPGSRTGTLKYKGTWEKIDGYFSRGRMKIEESVYMDASLKTKDRGYGGTKPFRTYNGMNYQGGISDHYPVLFRISY